MVYQASYNLHMALARSIRQLSTLRGALPLLFFGALMGFAPLHAYECDQYWNRLTPLEDSAPLLNQRFQETLEELAAGWRGPEDRRRFATQLYQRLGSRHWVDPIERWAMTDPSFERLPQSNRETIYSDIPFWARRVAYFSGIGGTIRIGDSLIGTDKLGHFVSQGWKYYKRHLRGMADEQVVVLGRRNERGWFGSMFTGIFSNADLVANYEGYRFYRSLFEDDIIDGLPALVVFGNETARVQRQFDIRRWVNDYWDEALNPNHYSDYVKRHLRDRLVTLCRDYEQEPAAWRPDDVVLLRERYRLLGMQEAPEMRLDQVCEDPSEGGDVGGQESAAHRQERPIERPSAAGSLSSAALR